jgi:hypothetical protein
LFVALSVATPWVFHQFHLAGATFLPMHIFVLAAGLLFGWQVGLSVGLITPLISYAISGMPGLQVLPQVIVELSVYGLAAGLLREKLNLRVAWALIGAMAAGRLALLLAASIAYLLAGEAYSPLGTYSNPLLATWATIKQGAPGIALQLALIPGAIWLLSKTRNA